jgi:hypothetical protein
MATKKTPDTETTAAVHIPRIATQTILVPIVGTAPLIMNRWSAKAKQQMLDAQQGRKSPKLHRDPDADYEASIYRLGENRYGFPTLAFKAATIESCRLFSKTAINMTSARQFIFMHGEWSPDGIDLLTEIHGEPKMRTDMVRPTASGSDMRFRAEFTEWTATLRISYVTTTLSRESVLALVDAGGMTVGVGEWRPARKGQNGTYQIPEGAEIEPVK